MRHFHKIEDALAHFTECQLATVEDLRDRKKFPKGELQRHQSIADDMVNACKNFKVEIGPRGFPRLARLLGVE